MEIPVGGKSTIKCCLWKKHAAELERGSIDRDTGKVKRNLDLTGSVGTVDAEQLKRAAANVLNQALSGKIAGVR